MGKFDRVLIASDFDNTLVDTQAAIDHIAAHSTCHSEAIHTRS